MIVDRTKSKIGIRAEIISSQSGGTEEWMSECRIYKNDQLIGTLDDSALGDMIMIRGEFDYKEIRKDGDGVPVLVDDAFYLDTVDLQTMIEIMEHWGDDEVHCEKWEMCK